LLNALSDCAAKGGLNELLAGFSAQELARLLSDWEFCARDDQWPPLLGANGAPWRVWMILGGRGAGKTRAGAEWVKAMALGRPQFALTPTARIALVGESAADVRDVMVEGVSGILAVHGPSERPRWESSRRRLTWDNGAVAQAFSAEDPDSLRGPQFAAAWCDELAKWRYAAQTWDMLQFGLRLGDWPRQLVTTTPRPLPVIKKLLADPSVAVTRASTRDNAVNLAPSFVESVVAQYAGTRLGRQELDGELIEDRADALWTRDMLERARVKEAPPLKRIVVAVDPPASSTKRADSCGIVAAGIDANAVVYILADASVSAVRPAQWARAAIALYHELSADALVAEVNQGGDMVCAVLNEADPSAPVTMVRATRGKYVRSAPAAQLYEQDRVRHVGAFPALEDEMCDFGLDGLSSGRSPDRLDALVWAITDLALRPKPPEPRMRRV
jgi:phage terminase large subunit-like protein